MQHPDGECSHHNKNNPQHPHLIALEFAYLLFNISHGHTDVSKIYFVYLANSMDCAVSNAFLKVQSLCANNFFLNLHAFQCATEAIPLRFF